MSRLRGFRSCEAAHQKAYHSLNPFLKDGCYIGGQAEATTRNESRDFFVPSLCEQSRTPAQPAASEDGAESAKCQVPELNRE